MTDTKGDLCKVNVKTKVGNITLDAEVVLSAVGIAANIEGIGLEEIGIATDKGKILTDKFYFWNDPPGANYAHDFFQGGAG